MVKGLRPKIYESMEFEDPPAETTLLAKDDIVNDETQFLTAIFADKDNDPNTHHAVLGTMPGGKTGAETLVAIVSWGYQTQVRVGATAAAAKGFTYMIDGVFAFDIHAPPTQYSSDEENAAWQSALERWTSAFQPTPRTISTPATRPDWVLEE